MKKHPQDKRFKDVEALKARLEAECPQPGDYLYDYKLQQALKDKNQYTPQEFSKLFKIDFEDLPISQITLKALKQRKFHKMTEIQRCAIPHALAGSTHPLRHPIP